MYTNHYPLAPTIGPHPMSPRVSRSTPINSDPKDERMGFILPSKLKEDFKQYCINLRVEMSDMARKLIEDEVEGKHKPDAFTGTDSIRLPFLAKAPAGPFREAIKQEKSARTLSPDVRDMIEAVEDDVIVYCDGESVEGFGIPDGSYLIMRPLKEYANPRRGEIALIQIEDKDGQVKSTIKQWVKSDPITLHDGDNEEVVIEEGTAKVTPVAVLRGLLSAMGPMPVITKR